MKRLDYIVKVHVGGVDEAPSIGLSGGVCTWNPSDQELGVLTERWVSGISDSVDISVSGNYAKYSSPTINIVKSKIVETTLNNYGLTLTGSRIEIIETDGTTELLLSRGIVLKLVTVGNVVSILTSHVANYYNTHLSVAVGDKYAPVVFGNSVDEVRLPVVEGATSEELTIGDGLIPIFEVTYNSKEVINIQTLYNSSIVTSAMMEDFLSNNDYVSMSGENTLICKLGNTVNSTTNPDGTFYWVRAYPLPMNIKDGDGNEYLQSGTNAVLSSASYDKIYTPYGSTLDYDGLRYKDGDNFIPFPSYIDSRVDYDDRIEILDSDGSGNSFINPIGFAGFDDGTAPIADMFSLLSLPIGDAGNYVGGGVWSNNATTTVINQDSDKYTDRSDYGSRAICEVDSSTVSGVAFSIWCVTKYQVKFSKSTVPDSHYITASDKVQLSIDAGGVSFSSGRYSVFAKTVKDTYLIYNGARSVGLGESVYLDNLLPVDTSNDTHNTLYRWENDANVFGESIDCFEQILEDYEKQAGYVIYIMRGASLQTSVSTTSEHIFTIKEYDSASREYNTNELYMDGVTGRNDINNVPISNTSVAYLSTLQLQNYQTLGISTPTATPASLSSGWGLQYPVDILDGVAIDASINIRNYNLKYQAKSVSTKDVKLDLIKYTTGIGHLDSSGLETWDDATNMYSGTGYIFDKSKIEGRPIIADIQPTRVYPEIGVTYSGGAISINNVEQEVYDSSYVTGVSDPVTARGLWFAGNLLYNKYGIKNTYPEKLGDISGIENESDAVSYIKNQYLLAGVIINDGVATLYKRYKASFVTSRKYIWDAIAQYGELNLGTPVRFSYPNIATGNSAEITSIKPDPLSGKTSIEIECVGESIATNENFVIIESGTQTDIIVESGTQPNIYKEEI